MNIKNLNRKSPRRRSIRSAFTLIELLLVISIIGVLASLSVGVIRSAQTDAQVAASRSRVTLIESAMEVQLEDFEVRRSPVAFGVISGLTGLVPNNVWENSSPGDDNFLLHAKNLKRMIVADLIRSEFPSGRLGQPEGLGVFPSFVMRSYLIETLGFNANSIDVVFREIQPANVSRWLDFGDEQTFDGATFLPEELGDLEEDDLEQLFADRFADSSEVLYQILSELEFEGTNVIDSLGSAAIGDTDGDGFPEVVDGFGEPLAFEFHQSAIEPVFFDTSSNSVLPIPDNQPETGVWGLTTENQNAGFVMTNFESVRPVLPTDLRFFVTSQRLLEIDQEPADIDPDPDF